MEIAITVLAWTLAVVAVIVGIPVSNYYFAKRNMVEAQTEAIRADTKFKLR